MTRRTLPQHGTRARYLRGCRCPECSTANRRYCKTYRLRVAAVNGDTLRIPVTRVEQHIRAWTQRGWSQRQIADAVGCSDRVIHNILTGSVRAIRPDIARRVLDADLNNSSEHGRASVDATGTRRRIQALAVVGWPFKQIAARAGVSEYTPGRVLTRPRVYVGTANSIADVYDEIATLDPQQHGISAFAANRTRNYARSQGWADPVFWEDYGGIDDPDAPETATEGGTPRYVALSEDAQWLMSAGYSLEHAAQRLGVTRAYLDQCIRRYRIAQQQALKEAA